MAEYLRNDLLFRAIRLQPTKLGKVGQPRKANTPSLCPHIHPKDIKPLKANEGGDSIYTLKGDDSSREVEPRRNLLGGAFLREQGL